MKDNRNPQEITSGRLTRFDAFRASLPLPEQRALDAKIERWIMVMDQRRHTSRFGVMAARELMMALVESNCELC